MSRSRSFTRMSIPPRRSRTPCATVAQPAAVVMSAAIYTPVDSSAGIACAVATTIAPALRGTSTTAAPMPLVPAVPAGKLFVPPATTQNNMKFITPIVVVLLQVSPVVAQAIRVNGTSVALAPPAGFVPSSRFPGFERPDLQSSVMVTEVPGPVADVSRGMTAASLATRGITLISSTRQLVDGRQALLLKVSQPAGGMTVHKWMIVSGDARTTVMIVATFPQEHESQIGDAMKDSLLTARWTVAAAPPDHFEGLSFRISPTTSLKIAGRMSNMLMLTESGQMGPLGPTAALFVIGTSLARVDLSDLKAFATTRASQTTQLKALRLSEQGATAIGNEAAYELVAEGTDIATGRLVTLYQVVLPDPQGYVLMQGMVDSTRAATMVPEFRKAAQTFRRTAR